MIKQILGKYYNETIGTIYQYLLENSAKFNDLSLFKAVQINCINASSTDFVLDERLSRALNLKHKFLKCNEKNDLKFLSIVLLDMNTENWQEAAYTLSDKIDYDALDEEFLEKTEPLRILLQLLYTDADEELIPNLHHLLKILPQDTNPSRILWNYFEMDADSLEDGKQFIEMANVILQYRPDDADVYNFLGYMLYTIEDYHSSMKHYNTSLNLCNAKPELYNFIGLLLCRIGYCFLSIGEYNEAIRCASKAIDKYEEFRNQDNSDKVFYPLVYTLKARVYLKQGDEELAYNSILLGLEYDSNYDDLYELMLEIDRDFE